MGEAISALFSLDFSEIIVMVETGDTLLPLVLSHVY